MPLLRYSKSLISLALLAHVSRSIYRYIQWKKKQKSKRRSINEVIAFSESTPSVESKYSLFRSLLPSSLDRVLFYLDQAQYSLDICMFIMSNKEISYMIQKLKKKGVKIRFIVDAEMAYTSGSETKRLEKQNTISLSWMKVDDSRIMHHKFCIIDSAVGNEVYKDNIKCVPFVMTGSLNWTMPATSGNYETVVVMSQHEIVKWYKYEFERLWLQFENNFMSI